MTPASTKMSVFIHAAQSVFPFFLSPSFCCWWRWWRSCKCCFLMHVYNTNSLRIANNNRRDREGSSTQIYISFCSFGCSPNPVATRDWRNQQFCGQERSITLILAQAEKLVSDSSITTEIWRPHTSLSWKAWPIKNRIKKIRLHQLKWPDTKELIFFAIRSTYLNFWCYVCRGICFKKTDGYFNNDTLYCSIWKLCFRRDLFTWSSFFEGNCHDESRGRNVDLQLPTLLVAT